MCNISRNVAAVLVLLYAVSAEFQYRLPTIDNETPPPPPLLLHQPHKTTQNPFEVYDTQSSEEFFDPMKQPDKAFEDFLLTNTKNYFVPSSLITIPMSAEVADVTDSATESFDRRTEEDDVGADVVVAPVAMRREDSTIGLNSLISVSSTSPNEQPTTLELLDGTHLHHTSEPSNIIDQLLIKEIEDADSNSSQLPYAAELTSNKQAKMMFVPSYEAVADVPVFPNWPLHGDNTIHADQFGGGGGGGGDSVVAGIPSNDTDDDEQALNQDLDVESPTTTLDPLVTVTQDLLALAAPTFSVAETTSTKTSTTTTTMAALVTTVRRKKIQTTPPRIYKFSADEILRQLLNDSFIRAPMAALIDTSAEVLRKTKTLWKAALRPQTALDIVLVAFNASGVGVTYSFKNTRTMIAGLESIQESNEGSGSAFFGIIRACELIPYDSAIFICTDTVPLDVNMAQYAAITLLKKRIRLNLIWFGPQQSDDNQTLEQNSYGGILGEVALRTGGEVMPVTEEALGPNGDFGLITLFLRNDIQGAQELDIPVEPTVSNVLLKLQGNVETATLDTPNGERIDLTDVNEVQTFAPESIQQHWSTVLPVGIDFQRQLVVRLNISHPFLGNYRLIINAQHPGAVYSVNVLFELTRENGTGDNDLLVDYVNDIDDGIISENFLDDDNLAARLPRSQRLQQQNNLELEDLEAVSEQIRFPNDDDVDTVSLNNDTISVMGRNTLQAVTKIELGIQSQLLASPGTTVQIYYEVTNLRDESTFHNFQVVDEQRYLRTLNPLSIWLTAGQTSTAVLTAYIPPNTDIGTKDKITFTSQGLGLASQAATLTVTAASSVQDTRIPNLYWAYGSRCDYKTGPGQCASAVWSLEITAQDSDTGIMRVQSKPAGLTIRTAFTAGTNNEVKATYTSSCCSTRVTITAYDVAGNQRAVTLDVTEFLLNEASIAAIALGVILLVLLLALLIAFCVWCCRKRRASRDLEEYRARSAAASASSDRGRST